MVLVPKRFDASLKSAYYPRLSSHTMHANRFHSSEGQSQVNKLSVPLFSIVSLFIAIPAWLLSSASARSTFHRLTEISPLLASTWLIGKRHIITWAELAFLGLDIDIVQVHVVLDGADILMPQERLQAENVATEHEVTYRERVPEDVSTDAL